MRALFGLGLAVTLFATIVTPSRGDLIVNGGFDTGDLSGWTTFYTPRGSASISVTSFNTTGSGFSDAATFNDVGITSGSYGTGNYQGGGLGQTVTLAAGSYVFSADIAAYENYLAGNGDAGVFNLLVDGSVVASDNLQSISGYQTLRDSVSASVSDLSAGSHTFQIEFLRNYYGSGFLTEYVDNVSLSPQSVPEPASIVTLGIAVLAYLGYRWRRRATLIA